jgi:APA family basic amino acid/polyamine antiporter
MAATLPRDTWIRLIVWTAIGVVIYFTYSYKRSKLRAGEFDEGQPAPARAPS